MLKKHMYISISFCVNPKNIWNFYPTHLDISLPVRMTQLYLGRSSVVMHWIHKVWTRLRYPTFYPCCAVLLKGCLILFYLFRKCTSLHFHSGSCLFMKFGRCESDIKLYPYPSLPVSCHFSCVQSCDISDKSMVLLYIDPLGLCSPVDISLELSYFSTSAG